MFTALRLRRDGRQGSGTRSFGSSRVINFRLGGFGFGLMLALTACSQKSPAVSVALNGELSELQTAFKTDPKLSHGDIGALRELAGAVALRDLYSTTEAQWKELLPMYRGCLRNIDGLNSVAEASSVKEGWLQYGLLMESSRSVFEGSGEGARAAKARYSKESALIALKDEAPRVRLNAVDRLGYESGKEVLQALKNTARRDPDELVRSLAWLSLSGLAAKNEFNFFIEGFKRGTENEQRIILSIAAREPWFSAGGKALLETTLLDPSKDLKLRLVAAELVHQIDAPFAPRLDEVLSAMLRNPKEQELPILVEGLPLSSEDMLKQLQLWSADDNPELALPATCRLAASPAYRKKQLQRLGELTKLGKNWELRVALCKQGLGLSGVDRRLLHLVTAPTESGAEGDSEAEQGEQLAWRRAAFQTFIARRQWDSAALGLIDDDIEIRARVSCAFLREDSELDEHRQTTRIGEITIDPEDSLRH